MTQTKPANFERRSNVSTVQCVCVCVYFAIHIYSVITQQRHNYSAKVYN